MDNLAAKQEKEAVIGKACFVTTESPNPKSVRVLLKSKAKNQLGRIKKTSLPFYNFLFRFFISLYSHG
jgi:hypothetical protein